MFSLILLLFAGVTYGYNPLFDFNDDQSRELGSVPTVPPYTGCYKPEDLRCKNLTPKHCDGRIVRIQCPRMCGICLPFTPKCPEEYPFGCCWTGERATDIKKSNCPRCENGSPICNRRAAIMKKDCDFSKQTEKTRRLCPKLCGACRDYGFEPCEDSDPRCAKMKDTSCCESSEILRELCRKTCGIC